MSSRPEQIVHSGVVTGADPRWISVEIQSASACAECHAKSLCSLDGMESKVIQVPSRISEAYEIGEKVEVVLRASMGLKAVWLCYCIPLLVLLAFILGLDFLGASEPVCALASLGGVALYYFILWLFRDSLRNEYVFGIRKMKQH